MIKYSKFTDNIGSGNFTDAFCQNTDKFRKRENVTPPHTSAQHALGNKCSQKLLDSAYKSTAVAIKIASKIALQKTAEATGDLIGKKITGKITSVSKKVS